MEIRVACEDRSVNPYWLEDPPVSRPSPRHEGTVDVAIVGAGVTGCAAALRLAEAGLHVRVHDERAVAEGASGRNGGFALRGGASRYDVARETYGRDQARAMWTWKERALDRIEELAGLAAEAGAVIREHDRIDDVGALDADIVVVATDGYGHGLVPELADTIWP